MTDSNHQPPEDETELDEAAAAFAALRRTVETQGQHLGAEITVIRRGLETAFEQFETFRQPADHTEDLAVMAEGIAHVVERLQAIEKSPILKNGPEYYARMIERSAESAMRIPVTQFDNGIRDLQRVAHELEGRLDSARERHIQNRWLGYFCGAGIMVGILMTLFLPRIFPGSIAPRVASAVMAAPPWQAGTNLMTYASPEGVSRVADADHLAEANKVEIAACRDAAKKTGKDQKCSITVAAPGP